MEIAIVNTELEQRHKQIRIERVLSAAQHQNDDRSART